MPVTSAHPVLVFAACALALPATAMERYVGTAYARGGTAVLYREVHLGDASRHLIVFQCPDGKPFARKRLRAGTIPTQPDFDFTDARNGYEDGVRGDGAQRVVYVRRVGGQRSEQALTVPPDAVIDAGFDVFLRARWDQVVDRGASAPFLMTGKGKFFPVKVVASGREGTERRIALKLDAWYGFAAPTIDVTYTEATRRLRRYEGPGTIRDARGKPADVRIEFLPADRTEGVPDTAWDQALALPLDGRCPA
ncbi:hypothetical protein [Luteibacter sp. ME-Dv--P-043b]|uniref:hypothetical protein n=1 Tax=Luteibacter sp. ME-Dv--P-043b TaxID=3040291 RepID=UPI002553376F|nr:hypothetical protein [Luteibacter sp. ME-Dv--P-043b]